MNNSCGVILFKDPTMQREFSKIVPALRYLISVYASIAWILYGDAIVITSIYREGSGSLHGFWRAVDIAILENGGMTGSEMLRKIINIRFPYGLGTDGRPRSTIPELRHGSAPHTHLQSKDKARW